MFLLTSNYQKLGRQRSFYYRDCVDGVIPTILKPHFFFHVVSQQVGNSEEERDDWKKDLCFVGQQIYKSNLSRIIFYNKNNNDPDIKPYINDVCYSSNKYAWHDADAVRTS